MKSIIFCNNFDKIMKFTVLIFVILLFGCNSLPTNDPYQLNNTVWVYVNKNDNNNRYTLSYTKEEVIFTIYRKSGTIYQASIHGTYTLSGDLLTEVYDDYIITSKYTGKKIFDLLDDKMIFRMQR